MTSLENHPRPVAIPFWFTKLGTAEVAAVARSIEGMNLSQGAVTAQFEARLAEFFGVEHVVATTSGSMALYLAATALGLGPGDEVIVPDRTFMATAHAMMLTGARVRLVDVEPGRPIIDVAQIEAAITSRTKAIVPVHLNGGAANIAAITSLAAAHGLAVIEDSAQAFASRSATAFLGTSSNAGCFSLGVTKMLTTGQGGLVVTNDTALAARMRRFRNQGVHDTFAASFEQFGFNLKYTDIQASIGLAQLAKLPVKITAHRNVHAYYTAALAELDYLSVLPVGGPHEVPLWTEALVSDPKRVIGLLEERAIQVRPYLPSLHISAYLGDFDERDFPNATRFARQGIFLPSGPDMPVEWLDRVAEALHDIAPRMVAEPFAY